MKNVKNKQENGHIGHTIEGGDAQGGGAKGGSVRIVDSPIIIHIHVHSNHESLAQRVIRGVMNLTGQKNFAIENANKMSQDQLEQSIAQVGISK